MVDEEEGDGDSLGVVLVLGVVGEVPCVEGRVLLKREGLRLGGMD